MEVEISPTEATFVRQAIAAALRAVPAMWDDEQRTTLLRVDERLCSATDDALSRSNPTHHPFRPMAGWPEVCGQEVGGWLCGYARDEHADPCQPKEVRK